MKKNVFEEEYKEISVLIPTYNAESTIVRAIDSVKKQTYQYWKVYVIDDSSNDNTINVAKELAVDEPKIKVLSLPEGKGKTRALRFGIDNICNTDYIMFLDSDDWLAETTLFQTLVYEGKKERAECICFNYVVNGKIGFPKLSKKLTLSSDEEYLKNILNRQYMDGNLWGGIYEFEKVKDKFLIQDFNHEDYVNKYNIIKECKKVLIIPVIGYEYYVNTSGITRKKMNERDKYYYIHTERFTSAIISKYPTLQKECDYFSNWVLLWTISRLADDKEHKNMDMYSPMMKVAKKNFCVFMKNPYFSKRERLTYLLIRFKVYGMAHKIYQKIKK
ncbi:MAG: glycosyltransferase [Lachnospiraceae bacterium]|nr:glycosyltransferase [Lachnospiraceae bacterium]